MFKINISIFFCLIYLNAFSQLQQYKNVGLNVGVISAIGTHINKFGIVLQGYYVYQFAQINASLRLYNNFKNIGPKAEYPELNAALGLCLGYGKIKTDTNLFINSVGNQTHYKNSIAYSYNVWKNTIKTNQVTGIIALQFNNFSFITENDLLAKPILDKFRTGAFLLQYQTKQIQYAINCTMFTGKMGQGIRTDTSFARAGYLNTIGGEYTNTSHGLLSAQLKFSNEYGQYLQANAGIDAEQVRNLVQNKLIHDMPFIPKKWNKAKNLHIPMLDDKCEQYLYKKDQKIKKPSLYLNGYTNATTFY